MPDYPQKPPMTSDEVAALLNEARIARLCTHNADGSIHCTPTWFQYSDDSILIGTQAVTRKVANVARDPNVTVLIDVEEPESRGVMIIGEAVLETVDAVARRVSIFERYMAPEEARSLAASLAAAFEPVIIRVVPRTMISWDYGKPGLLTVGHEAADLA